jgi:hypothetical protein
VTSVPGVLQVTWWPDGRPDMFVVVSAGRAHPCWLALADVIVHPTEPTVSLAARVAADILYRSSGCALAAVGVLHLGCLVRSRWGWVQLCPGSGSDRDTLASALLAYQSLVRG